MKVLIAEDDEYTREGLREIIEREGYQVVTAKDGIDALDVFRRERPDFLCLDIMMPSLNGYDVCKEIRKTNPGVPVIFISAKSEEIDKVVGLELGADDFIVKPFGVKEVVARIRAITRRIIGLKPQPAPEFMFGEWVVRPDKLTAINGSSSVELNFRELRILQLFNERCGRIVGREEFFRRCWEMDSPPNSRTLDQHISQLRKKLEKNPKDPDLIKTAHGVGYRYDG